MSAIQYFTWIIVAITLIADAIWISRNKRKWYYSISIIILSLHAFVFYMALYVDSMRVINLHNIAANKTFFSDWSSILRWHSFVTICSMELSRIPAPAFFKKIVRFFKKITLTLKGAHG